MQGFFTDNCISCLYACDNIALLLAEFLVVRDPGQVLDVLLLASHDDDEGTHSARRRVCPANQTTQWRARSYYDLATETFSLACPCVVWFAGQVECSACHACTLVVHVYACMYVGQWPSDDDDDCMRPGLEWLIVAAHFTIQSCMSHNTPTCSKQLSSLPTFDVCLLISVLPVFPVTKAELLQVISTGFSPIYCAIDTVNTCWVVLQVPVVLVVAVVLVTVTISRKHVMTESLNSGVLLRTSYAL